MLSALLKIAETTQKTWIKIFASIGLIIILVTIGMYAAPLPKPQVNLLPAAALNVLIIVTGQGKVTSEHWVEYESFPELGSTRMATGIKLGRFGRKDSGKLIYANTKARIDALMTTARIDPLTFAATTEPVVDSTNQHVYLEGDTWVIAPPKDAYFSSERKTFRLQVDGTDTFENVYAIKDFFYRVDGIQDLNPQKITVTIVQPYQAASYHIGPSGYEPATTIEYFDTAGRPLPSVSNVTSHLAFGNCPACNYRPALTNRSYSSFTITTVPNTLDSLVINARFDLKAESLSD